MFSRYEHPSLTFQITLTFEDFYIEDNFDFCFIYDGDSIGSPTLNQYTGYLFDPPVEVSSGPSMYIRFISDGSITASGFTASVTFNCGKINRHIDRETAYVNATVRTPVRVEYLSTWMT